jgi:2-amino-4-hydroxy-6-hydroxymethyldihydropteridine diphosphokinase
MIEIAFSLGTNLGDRLTNLREAVNQIDALNDTTVIAKSNIYETAPIGVKPQYADMAYLNAVIIAETRLSVDDISDRTHEIEAKMGRIRTEDRFAPRPIDIDILYAGNEIRDDDLLTLPHPRWAERAFVLQPLSDVRPYLVLPGSNQTVTDILANIGEKNGVTLFKTDW